MVFLAERVHRTIQRHSLLPPGARVLVALSGGADSTALACLLVDLSPLSGFSVVGVAHFNHRLRGAVSDEDQEFCRQLTARLGLAWQCEAGDVRGVAAGARRSIEDAGRELRYGFLSRAAARLGATHVATGHTRDDQAETVLLQMFRGAGPRGLGGMAVARDLAPPPADRPGDAESHQAPVRLVRPLLDTRHEDLVAWLGGRGIPFREDESNQDSRFLRNRVRHEVIPFLERTFSPSVSRVLARNAAVAASDARFLDALALEAFARLVRVTGDGVEVDRAGVLAEPEAVGRRVMLRAAGNLAAGRFVGLDQGDRLLDLARGACHGPIALPGVVASAVGAKVLLAPSKGRGGRRAARAGTGMNFSRSELSIPGEACLEGTGRLVSSDLRPWAEAPESLRGAPGRSGGDEAVVDAARAVGLGVRRRRPGDWFRPLGLGGRKKLQDYFVDRKVPREERDRVPLVVDRRDRIVWVAGHGIDEEFRVGAGTRDVVILRLRGESA